PGPEQDVEVIDMLCELFRRLGIQETHLLLNTIGDQQTRDQFKTALKDYLTPHKAALSADSQIRYEKNPLRILDSKSPQDKKIVENAPSIQNFLSDAARDHFEKVKEQLTSLGIAYTIEPKLVRGLDYYNQTVFEITSGVLGAQNSIGAGGRYDGLVKRFGGGDIPSVGFSVGIERILSTMQGQNIAFPKPPAPFVHLLPIDEASKATALELTYALRHAQIPAETYLRGRKMQKALQDIATAGSTYCIVIGENELKTGQIELKEMESRKTETINLASLVDEIKKRWND
ncbi:MAG: HisS family protein, partial [Simkaniaceae bacterium]|nr:HisS family protein [Simkaniaceae bacterium]